MNSQVAQLSEQLAAAEAATREAEANLLVSESEYDRQARIALEQAADQIKQIKSRLEFANANLARNRQLLPSGAITQQQFEAVESQVKSLTAELNQAT